MTATAEMLFNLQKFQILQLYTDPQERRGVTDAYAFAWSSGVFPVQEQSASWHQPYEDFFDVGEEMLVELLRFLDGLWIGQKTITFYDLEDHYDIHGQSHPGPVWDRSQLIDACRYFRLRGAFDDRFWLAMFEGANCPTEARCIMESFGPEDVYFL